MLSWRCEDDVREGGRGLGFWGSNDKYMLSSWTVDADIVMGMSIFVPGIQACWLGSDSVVVSRLVEWLRAFLLPQVACKSRRRMKLPFP